MSNSSENSSADYFACETSTMDQITQILVPTLFAIVVLIGVIGNSMVVTVVLINRQMHSSTNVLIVGLAVADLMFLLACVPPTAIDYSTTNWVFPYWWCQVINYLQHLFAYQTVWTLVLMALDRFLAVVLPIWSMGYRTVRNTTLLLCLLWTITSTGCIPIAFQFEVLEYVDCNEQKGQCIPSNIMLPNKTLEVMLFYMSFNLFGYVLPLSLTIVLYMAMIHKLWRTQPAAPKYSMPSQTSLCLPGPDNSRRVRQAKARKRVTRVVMGVTLTFAVCWLPLNVGFFITGYTHGQIFYEYGDVMIPVQIASQVLAYTNSCLNPILYAFLSEHFRTAFKDILRKCVPSWLVDRFGWTAQQSRQTYEATGALNQNGCSTTNARGRCNSAADTNRLHTRPQATRLSLQPLTRQTQVSVTVQDSSFVYNVDTPMVEAHSDVDNYEDAMDEQL